MQGIQASWVGENGIGWDGVETDAAGADLVAWMKTKVLHISEGGRRGGERRGVGRGGKVRSSSCATTKIPLRMLKRPNFSSPGTGTNATLFFFSFSSP